MTKEKITICAAILIVGLAIQAAAFFLLPDAIPPLLPAFACIAAVASYEDYMISGVAGLAAGIMLAPFAGTTAVAAAGIIACPAGALAASALFQEMNKKGEELFSPVFSVFSGTMTAGMFIMAAGLAGGTVPGPGKIMVEFTSLLFIALLAGVLCQGLLIAIKNNDKKNDKLDNPVN